MPSPDHVPESADTDGLLSAPPGAAAINRLSAVETVRARILLSVEHGLLAPGDRLPKVEQIAEGLEVSPITARRGLESLVGDGVLLRRPGRGGGTFVADSPPRLHDSAVMAYRADTNAIHRLIDQRVLMESAIVHQTALVADAAQCDQLDEYIEQSQRASNWLEHHLPDTRFHHQVAHMSGLQEVPAYLTVYDALVKYYVPYPMDQLEVGRDEHRALVAAFRGHDPVSAVKIVREHVGSLRREMFTALS